MATSNQPPKVQEHNESSATMSETTLQSDARGPQISVIVNLYANNNTIKFYNPSARGPDIDKIVV